MTISSEESELKKQMVPSFWNYFKSFYYTNTHIQPIDLKHVLPTLGCPDDAIVKTAQSITSLPGVQQILGQPFSYKNIKVIEISNEIMELNGFRLKVERQLNDGC